MPTLVGSMGPDERDGPVITAVEFGISWVGRKYQRVNESLDVDHLERKCQPVM